MEIFIASIWGLIIGSFLNVVIHRLPKAILKDPNANLDCLLWPASTAPCCGHHLSWLENIPVISWVILKGRCKHCNAPISPRYLLVEVLTSASFAWSAWQFDFSLIALIYAIFFSIAICLLFIDLETFLLPDRLTLAMLWLGLLGASLNYLPVTPQDAIFGASLGYVLPWSINRFYLLIRKHDGFGGGDFKLLAALGAWTGWLDIVPVLCGASVIGLLVIGSSAFLKRQNLSMKHAFPFGPFLILSGLSFILIKI
ncbi:A24 family peptidase [Polynucleobacter sp. AP-Kolm-20A-A1]|uniref:prepilin peptidase n=1 Tax=Polynucleobacter sp. AP-Kolm-20A-A1 TaxID=2081041 RepID=UPI001BFDBA18|nr:A24 family peptidase [Polynucleobacter sp. AP-Kolm-20A-A1]QWE21453.1 prepilin peptidase [Polynucleobacter sp. AP-Kolm-20A-A1]